MDPFLTCKQMADFLGDYFEGALAPDQKREFERHLSVCPPCIVYLESYKTTVALTKLARPSRQATSPATDAPTSSDVPEQLVQAILAARRKK